MRTFDVVGFWWSQSMTNHTNYFVLTHIMTGKQAPLKSIPTVMTYHLLMRAARSTIHVYIIANFEPAVIAQLRQFFDGFCHGFYHKE